VSWDVRRVVLWLDLVFVAESRFGSMEDSQALCWLEVKKVEKLEFRDSRGFLDSATYSMLGKRSSC
jgi:hypothetical protein